MSDTPVILPDDPAALKAMIAHLQAENARIAAENMRVQAGIEKISATLRAHEALVQALQIQIARLKKQKFGASSERIEREIEQLELALEHTPRHYHPKPASAARFGVDPPTPVEKGARAAMHKSQSDEPAASGTSLERQYALLGGLPVGMANFFAHGFGTCASLGS